MSKITITQGKNPEVQLSQHFKMKEFWSNSYNAPATFQISGNILKALELVRLAAGVPIIINSCYRTKEHNNQLEGSSANSQHCLGTAVDFKFAKDNETNILKLKEAIETRSEFYYALRRIGVNGFGLYDTFVHLDCRTTFLGKNVDDVGKVALWNYQINLKKKSLKGSLLRIKLPSL